MPVHNAEYSTKLGSLNIMATSDSHRIKNTTIYFADKALSHHKWCCWFLIWWYGNTTAWFIVKMKILIDTLPCQRSEMAYRYEGFDWHSFSPKKGKEKKGE